MALVTGASAGIGTEICKMLAGKGVKVVGCARREDRVKEMAKEYPLVTPYQVDLALCDDFWYSLCALFHLKQYFAVRCHG